MKATNLYVAIDDARPGALIDTSADPAEGHHERPGIENHDTVICAARVWGQQDGYEELEISNLVSGLPVGFGATAVVQQEAGGLPAR
jgi:hypothetical protein